MSEWVYFVYISPVFSCRVTYVVSIQGWLFYQTELICFISFIDSHYPVSLMFDVDGLDYFSSGVPLCKDKQNLFDGSIVDTYLDESCGIHCTKDGLQTLYKHVFNAAFPSMAFIGIAVTDLPFLCYDLQVRWVFSVWTGFISLPSAVAMITDTDADYAAWKILGLSHSHYTHLLSDRQWEYYDQLATEGANRPPDNVVKKLHDATCHYKARNCEGFKSYRFAVTGHSSFVELSEHKSEVVLCVCVQGFL